MFSARYGYTVSLFIACVRSWTQVSLACVKMSWESLREVNDRPTVYLAYIFDEALANPVRSMHAYQKSPSQLATTVLFTLWWPMGLSRAVKLVMVVYGVRFLMVVKEAVRVSRF